MLRKHISIDDNWKEMKRPKRSFILKIKIKNKEKNSSHTKYIESVSRNPRALATYWKRKGAVKIEKFEFKEEVRIARDKNGRKKYDYVKYVD